MRASKTDSITTFIIASCLLVGCSTADYREEGQASQQQDISADSLPMSDPKNTQGWVLNVAVSDEFNDGTIDHKKWYVNGLNDDYYHWKGRTPSQFAAHNVREEDGKLKLTSRWEPDFDYADEERGGARYGDAVAPVTAAAVISKTRFLYGYMEARTKAAPASMTSAFWTLGHQSELDIYEQMGTPKNKTGNIRSNSYASAVHDWRPGRYVAEFGKNKTFHNHYALDFNVSDEFHVYAAEWGEGYIKLFLDGDLIHETTQAEADGGWVLTNPLELWFDMEIFHWLGYPHAEELPADYEIDYVRVWQKPYAGKLDRAHFGFEGPLLMGDWPAAGKMKPGHTKANGRFETWQFKGPSAGNFKIDEKTYAGGIKSLSFSHEGDDLSGDAVAFSPAGSVDLKAGKHFLKLKVRKAAETSLKALSVQLAEPSQRLAEIDLQNMPQNEWITLELPFYTDRPSKAGDYLEILLEGANFGPGASLIWIDDLEIIPFENP